MLLRMASLSYNYCFAASFLLLLINKAVSQCTAPLKCSASLKNPATELYALNLSQDQYNPLNFTSLNGECTVPVYANTCKKIILTAFITSLQ